MSFSANELHYEQDLLARLTAAAYDVALRQPQKASFLDLQLGIWEALREVLEEESANSEWTEDAAQMA
jgi:hypothetical protein